MASVPCTLILRSKDAIELPPEALFVISKQLFRFGVKSLERKADQIILKLSYTPRADTMARKLRNLPAEYVRLAVETDEELETLKTYMGKFRFDLREEDRTLGESRKRLLDQHEDGPSCSQAQEVAKKKKIKILENRIIKPSASSSSTTCSLTPTLFEIFDDDADEFEGQKYTVQ